MIRYLWWKFGEWRFDRRMARQRNKRGFADIDIWSMDYWFAKTVSKMFYNLRDRKHGAPELEFEEVESFPLQWVDEQCKILLEQKKEKNRKIKKEEDQYEEEVNLWNKDSIFDRWWLILSRIGWCLEQSNDGVTDIVNEYEEEYHEKVWGKNAHASNFNEWWDKHFEVDEVDEKGKPKTYRLVTNEPEPELREKYWTREEEIRRYREACKDEAMDLIKKYFYALWD